MLLNRRARTLSRNAHLRDRVDRVVDAVTPLIQQHNATAIESAGYPVVVYKRYTSGVPCSCTAARHAFSGLELYDDNGDASPAVIDSIREQAAFGLVEYNPTGASLPATIETTEPVENIESGPIVEPSEPTVDTPIESYNAGSCAVCFGTGFIGGYYPLNSLRTVRTYLDIQASQGVSIDRSVYPHAIEMSGQDSWVEFRLPPTGEARYVGLTPDTPSSIVNVWNNSALLEVNGMTPDMSVSSAIMGSATLHGLSGKLPREGCLVRIRFSDLAQEATDEQVVFTHLEVMTNRSRLPTLVDIPSLDMMFDPNKLTPHSQVTMELPASVPILGSWDVVADAINQQLWLVSSSKPTGPSSKSIWFQTAEVTPVEPHWLQARLILPSPEWLNSRKRSLKPVAGSQIPYSRRGGY